MSAGLIGCVETPAQGRNQVPPGAVWCADNGCFGKGWPGYERWWAWLEQHPGRELCLFATAPDVVGDAVATLERSLPWLPKIRELGIPAALVAQDGLEDLEVPWSAFDVLFVGGSTDWKLGPAARRLVGEAKRRGLSVHMGRVNSRRRWDYAREIGCDSVDGTKLTFGPAEGLARVLSWVASNDQLFLEGIS